MSGSAVVNAGKITVAGFFECFSAGKWNFGRCQRYACKERYLFGFQEDTGGVTNDGVFLEGSIISPPECSLFTIKISNFEKNLSPIFALASGEVTWWRVMGMWWICYASSSFRVQTRLDAPKCIPGLGNSKTRLNTCFSIAQYPYAFEFVNHEPKRIWNSQESPNAFGQLS